MAKLLDRVKSLTTPNPATYQSQLQAMVEGDHWLNGEGWLGPRPLDAKKAVVMRLIEGEFVYKNVIAELCRRHRNSVVGQEPIWSFVLDRALSDGESPTEQEAAVIQEVEAAMTVWWDERRAHAAIKEAAMQMLWNQARDSLEGVAALRLYLPSSRLEEQPDGTRAVPGGLDLERALEFVYVHALRAGQGGLIRDTDGEPLAGVYHWTEDNRSFLEVNALAKTLVAEELLEPGLYEDDVTVVQHMAMETNEVIARAGYELGGRLLTVELRREDTLITPSVVSNQKLLNLAYTMMGRNVVQGGFLERTVLNAQMPGEFVDDQGNPSDMGTKFRPDPLYVGAGSLNFFSGLPVKDELGNVTGYATPSVVYRDPVPVTTFEDTAAAAKRNMYEEAQQLHVLISGDATASGESRKQAANDFVSSLAESARVIEEATRDVLETVLAWAAYFADASEAYSGLRAEAKAVITAVQPTPEEVRVNLEQYNAGVLSRETTMARNGVEDVTAEVQRLERELAEAMAARELRMRMGLEPGAMTEQDEEDADRAEAQRGAPATA